VRSTATVARGERARLPERETVAHDGTAEKVRMLSARRFSDAAILSQIKTWRFTPTLRDGEPVRYRVLLHDPAEAH
jgi:hypothetical protein